MSLMVITILVEQLPRNKRNTHANFIAGIFLMTTLLFGSFEVRIPAIFRAWSLGVSEFYSEFSPSLREYGKFLFFNQDLKARVANGVAAPENSRVVLLTDNASGYFYDSEILSLQNYHFDLLFKQYHSYAGVFCVWQFADELGIRYLLASNNSFQKWPSALGPLISQSENLSSQLSETHRHLWNQDIAKEASRESATCTPQKS
jgi:hypothetical protein